MKVKRTTGSGLFGDVGDDGFGPGFEQEFLPDDGFHLVAGAAVFTSFSFVLVFLLFDGHHGLVQIQDLPVKDVVSDDEDGGVGGLLVVVQIADETSLGRVRVIAGQSGLQVTLHLNDDPLGILVRAP